MMWERWNGGERNWPFGPLQPTEILFEYAGPAIFTAEIGLQSYLFYKSAEHKTGDYFIAVDTDTETLNALKSGRLSVRGALQKRDCYAFDVDLDLNVTRFQKIAFDLLTGLIPASGVPLYPSMSPAWDTVAQATSAVSFKFFGEELRDGLMPLGIFKNLVGDVYDFVRRTFVPPTLSASKANDLVAYPMRQPVLASLLIAIDAPEVDVQRLRRRHGTKDLDPGQLVAEAEKEGARVVSDVERAVDRAASGKVTKGFARENWVLFDNLHTIVPSESGDVSKLQLASYLGGKDTKIELDREIGERIRFAYKTARDNSVDVTGVVVGVIESSHHIRVRRPRGREVTCYIIPSIFEDMLIRGDIAIGRKVQVTGAYQKRTDRDLMHVEGRPRLL